MRFLILLSVFVATSSASFHSAPPLPNDWHRSELLTLGDAPMSFSLYLKETTASIANIKKIALAVSDPRSDHYGEFLADPQALATPAASALAEVQDWLESTGARITSVVGSRVEIASTQAQAEKLFSTKFVTLVHKSGLSVVRAGDYLIPDAIDAKVATIFGLHGLPLPRTGPPRPPLRPHPRSAQVTPDVLISTYKAIHAPNSHPVHHLIMQRSRQPEPYATHHTRPHVTTNPSCHDQHIKYRGAAAKRLSNSTSRTGRWCDPAWV